MGKKIQRDPQSVALAQTILEKYQPETEEDVQEAMKDIFGPIFEAMLQGEMNAQDIQVIITIIKKHKIEGMDMEIKH